MLQRLQNAQKKLTNNNNHNAGSFGDQTLRKSNNEAMWTPEIIEVGITAAPTVVLNGLIVYSHDTRGA